MKHKFFLAFFGLFFAIFSPFFVYAQTMEYFSFTGMVVPPMSWLGGNSGKVWFLDPVNWPNRFAKTSFNGDGKLFGHIWLWSSGWATFEHGIQDEIVYIQCPTGILWDSVRNKINNCPVKGSVWSQTAGWIMLDKERIGVGEGVYFNPNSANIEGFGWSRVLGWVPFFSSVKFDDNDKNPDIDTIGGINEEYYKNPNNAIDGININFIGKVAVIGNIAGSRVFDVINSYSYVAQQSGYSYNTLRHTPIFNEIYKNIAQLTRNVNLTQYALTPYNGFIYSNSKDYRLTNIWYSMEIDNEIHISQLDLDASLRNLETIIVKGKDVIIDSDFNAISINQSVVHPTSMRAIIALRDELGNGGNIYITDKVTKIYAYIIAEGSVFSGDKIGWNAESYISSRSLFNQPNKQLYINGLLISKNTIGGVGQISSICPVMTNCQPNTEKEYDMNYFRNYDHKKSGTITSLPSVRHNLQDKIKSASVIIDYNPNILIDPPVGLELFR